MNTRKELTLVEILEQLLIMFDNKGEKDLLYVELRDEYNQKILDGSVSGSEALEAYQWWLENPKPGKFNPEFEQNRLFKLTTGSEFLVND